MNKIVTGHRSKTFARNAISMFCRHRRFYSLLRGFIWETFWMQFPPQPLSCCWSEFFLVHGMAASKGLSNFLIAFLKGFFVIMVIPDQKIDASQSSSIVELWHLVFPFLLFSILSGFPNLGPYFWPCMIWSGSRLNFCQSPSGLHISLERFFFQLTELRKTFPRI